LDCDGVTYTSRPIAELAGVIVFEIARLPVSSEKPGVFPAIPDAKSRAAVQTQISGHYHENLLVFVDAQRAQSVWYWVKREGNKRYPRSHYYVKGQTGDLFLSKLAAMFVDIGELDEAGNLPVVEAASRVQASFDVERVTKRFYNEFQQVQTVFQTQIAGIPDEGDRRWYTSVILNRLMFVYFLQRKGFVDGDLEYLSTKLEAEESRFLGRNRDSFYRNFLLPLFFEGFAKPEERRSPETRALLGDVRYLNGGLFLPHPIEVKYGDAIAIPDAAFANLFDLFRRYSWNLDDTPGGRDDEINPAVLGYIFEKYINQKAFGAYYTREEITEYLCEQTIHRLILAKVAELALPVPGLPAPPTFDSVPELLLGLDANLCTLLLHDILPSLSLLDPACGSGAFLVAAMKTLEVIYQGAIGRIPFLKDAALLQRWLTEIEKHHPNLDYFIKKRIISDNLFGVDIMPEAVEIARLRLFLALVASAQTVNDLEPLPNIDFNILAGNSLIGLLRVDEGIYNQRYFQANMFEASYREMVDKRNRLLLAYRNALAYIDDLQSLRDKIAGQRATAVAKLNEILLGDFKDLGIQYEQATWDAQAGREGKPKKRALTLADIEALQPFHWGYEFDEVMNERGGFDAIITNPPWEVFQTDEKEFFQEYAPSIQKKKLRIEDWKKQMKELLTDPEICAEWLAYASSFPYQSAYFKKAEQYKHAASGKTNLYQLFVEQCYNLLRPAGECGIVIPSSIYTDHGATGLRQLLFEQTHDLSLFGLSNERYIFEGIHHAFKLCLLTFEKGGVAPTITAAFRINPREAVSPSELENFLRNPALHLQIPIALVRCLAPDSASVMEFHTEIDLVIAEKLLRFPLLGETLPDTWNVLIGSEFNITSDSHLFETQPGPKRLLLFTGKMFHQFCGTDEHSGYWIEEQIGRSKILGRDEDVGQAMDYQSYRWVYRRIASNTNERTFISTIAPPNVFTEVNSPTLKVLEMGISNAEMLFLSGITNSFVLDWMVRQKVTTTLNYFYIYQLPIPRLTAADPAFAPIVERAARLICTTPEFDDLAEEIGFFLKNPISVRENPLSAQPNPVSGGLGIGEETGFFGKNPVSGENPISGKILGVTDPVGRARLRAELDGLIAHVYGLTEAEFVHILGTFPLVEEQVKAEALAAFAAFSGSDLFA